jgi:hypothetical protein
MIIDINMLGTVDIMVQIKSSEHELSWISEWGQI